ncbi:MULTISPECIES: sulfotransferase family protein [Robiginitalea]|nr:MULTISPECIES: sulfotransferase [Robiginitalea]MDC6353197.1 sulfotransferase [Robiginitalea sp. PM2]MDC6373636.1 sulfotransferase [Robiginitalea sp. SP8]
MAELTPNVFLIGVQKAATTSLYDWLAQHPEVCAPFSMKDTPFFIDDELFEKGTKFLDRIYRDEYSGQPAVLNGSANIIYFEKAIQRIASLNPDAKLILVLRNPVERAISAYNFAVKRNMEQEILHKAISLEESRIREGDLRTLSNNTYVDHGRYFTQITRLRKYFPAESAHIVFYEEIKNDPLAVVRDAYEFIGVDPDFEPELKQLNKTGEVRFPWIRNALYSQSGIKKALVRYIIDPLVPYNLKYKLKIFFLNLVTSQKSKKRVANPDDNKARELIREALSEEIEQLEELLGTDLKSWKS